MLGKLWAHFGGVSQSATDSQKAHALNFDFQIVKWLSLLHSPAG